LPCVTHGKLFAVCITAFAVCIRHTANQAHPVVSHVARTDAGDDGANLGSRATMALYVAPVL